MGIAYEAWIIEAQCDMCGKAKIELHGDTRLEAVQRASTYGWQMAVECHPLVVCPDCKGHPEVRTE